MQPRRSIHFGLILLVGSFVLALVRFALPFLWDAVLVRGTPASLFGQAVPGFWIPLAADIVDAALAGLGILGFVFLRRGRWELGPEYASRIGLALLALLTAVAVLAAWFATGVLLGYVTGVSYLVPVRRILALAATVLLGFAMYWALASLPLPGTRPVAAVAFALGVAGGVAGYLATLGFRRTEIVTLRGASDALTLVSLTLWLGLCTWGWQSLKTGGAGPRAAIAARSP